MHTGISENQEAKRRDAFTAISLLFATGSLFDASSGPHLALQQTTKALRARGHKTIIVGTRGRELGPVPFVGDTHAFRRFGPRSAHFAPRLAPWLAQHSGSWDLASMQGVWLDINRQVAAACMRDTKPYMITAHGAFNPAALQISSRRKALARRTYLARAFNNAECYQALTGTEYRFMRSFGIRKPICIVGHGIDIPDLEREVNAVLPAGLGDRRTCLYLGRLHPIKGVDQLLRAWATKQPPDEWQLIIAGDGDKRYAAHLQLLARELPCKNVHFTGFAGHDLKQALFRHADLFVLPSRSEGLAMAALEALSYSVPVLMTTACSFPEAARAGAAIEVPASPNDLSEGLKSLFALSPEALLTMGLAGRDFVRDEYAWSHVCARLEAVYRWMLRRAPAPDYLVMD